MDIEGDMDSKNVLDTKRISTYEREYHVEKRLERFKYVMGRSRPYCSLELGNIPGK